MIARSATEIAALTGGNVVAGDGSRRATCVSIDSRTLEPGAVFFAIRGPQHDGHEYLPQAAARGATVAVTSVDVPRLEQTDIVRVEDTTRALGDLAARERRERGWRVIAITGSAGKTTTRELTAHALASRWATGSSPGNLNNQWGVPLALLGLADDVEAAVIELGMNHPGEIAGLARIADPDVGVITNAGRAHLGHFAGESDIARAKLELFDEMRPGTTAIVPANDPLLEPAARETELEVRTFGLGTEAAVHGSICEGDLVSGQQLEALGQTVRLRLWGRHAALDALAALAAVTSLGVSAEEAMPRFGEVEALPGRGRLLRPAGGPLLIDESYNSNPSALLAVVGEISQLSGSARRIGVLGDMLELGEQTASCHEEAGEAVARAGFDLLLAVGGQATTMAGAARAAGLPRVETAADAARASPLALQLIVPGDVVLIKGSRGVRLEHVVQALAARDWAVN